MGLLKLKWIEVVAVKLSIENDVLKTNEGLLFLYQGAQRQFDYLTRKSLIAKSSIDNFNLNIESRSALCKSLSIPYVHAVFPSKPSVLRGKVKGSFEVKHLFNEDFSSNNVVYPLHRLMNSRENVFKKKDTHMNGCGDWLVFEKIMDELGLSDFLVDVNPEFVEKPYVGDLDVMLGNSKSVSSDVEYKSNNFYKVNNVKFLKGNTGRIFISRNPLAKIKKRILIFGDSFLVSMLNIFGDFFSDVLLVRHPCFSPDVVHLYGPDYVVTGNAERYLVSTLRDSDATPLLLRDCYADGYRPAKDFLESLKAQLSFSYFPKKYTEWSKIIDSRLYRDEAILANRSGDLKLAFDLIKKAKYFNNSGSYIDSLYKNYQERLG